MTDAEKLAAGRIAAARWCSTSFHSGWLSPATLLIPCFTPVSALAALVAIASGIYGLARLHTGGTLPNATRESSTPLQRVAVKMSKRADRQGKIGLLPGLVLACVHIFFLSSI